MAKALKRKTPTKGEKLAAQGRKSANKMTDEQREAAMKSAALAIYGGGSTPLAKKHACRS